LGGVPNSRGIGEKGVSSCSYCPSSCRDAIHRVRCTHDAKNRPVYVEGKLKGGRGYLLRAINRTA
jgi:hypothetical protein